MHIFQFFLDLIVIGASIFLVWALISSMVNDYKQAQEDRKKIEEIIEESKYR